MITGIFTLAGVIIGSLISGLIHWRIFKRERKDKFRLAALDKRLKVHQEAYTLWWELLFVINDNDKRGDVVIKSQKWWRENCLYLDEKSREAFSNCYMLVFNYNVYKNEGKAGETWNKIMETGKIIAQGVELTPLKDEGEIIKKDDKF